MTHLAIRFLLELAALVAAAIAGASIGDPPLGAVGGALVAAAYVAVWALWIAPRARFALLPVARLAVGTVLMLAAALGLVLVGDPVVGEVLVALIVANAAMLAITGAYRATSTGWGPGR